MHTLFYVAAILLTFAVKCHCAPVVQSDSEAANVDFVGNPQYNVKRGIVEGDIVVDPRTPKTGTRGVAIRWASSRWIGGIVPYEFAGNHSLNDTLFIEQQMRAIENLTMANNSRCVQFRPKTVNDPYFLTIFNGSGCSAPVGSWGTYNGTRPVSLLSGLYSTCMVSGIVQHELSHALGLYHEQSRPDRDTYVNIVWSNINSVYTNNFVMYNNTDVDTQMTPYDYGSVMHYERNAFAINSSTPTIIPLMNSTAFIGQRVRLSPIDILEIQRMYGCVPTPTSTSTVSTTSTASVTMTTTASSTMTATTTATMSTTRTTTTTTATTTTRTSTTSTSTLPSTSSTATTSQSTTASSTSTSSSSSNSSGSTSTRAPATTRSAAVRHAAQWWTSIHALYLAFMLLAVQRIC